MAFEDIIEALRTGGELDLAALADTLQTQAKTLEDGYTASVSAKDAAITESQAKIAALQAHNYELMMKKAPAEPLEPENKNSADGPSGIKSLF